MFTKNQAFGYLWSPSGVSGALYNSALPGPIFHCHWERRLNPLAVVIGWGVLTKTMKVIGDGLLERSGITRNGPSVNQTIHRGGNITLIFIRD